VPSSPNAPAPSDGDPSPAVSASAVFAGLVAAVGALVFGL
jgi:hypothetical protein